MSLSQREGSFQKHVTLVGNQKSIGCEVGARVRRATLVVYRPNVLETHMPQTNTSGQPVVLNGSATS